MSDSLIAHLGYGFIIPTKGKQVRKRLSDDISKKHKDRIILNANQYNDADYKFKYVPLHSLVNALIKEDDPFEVKYSGNLWNGIAGAVVFLKEPEIETFYEPMEITGHMMEAPATEDILALEKFTDKYFPDIELGWIIFPSIG